MKTSDSYDTPQPSWDAQRPENRVKLLVSLVAVRWFILPALFVTRHVEALSDWRHEELASPDGSRGAMARAADSVPSWGRLLDNGGSSPGFS